MDAQHLKDIEGGALGGRVELGDEHFGDQREELGEEGLDKLGMDLDELGERLEGDSAHFFVFFDRLDGHLEKNREDIGERLEETLVGDRGEEAAEGPHAGHLEGDVLRSLNKGNTRFFSKIWVRFES